MDQFFAATDISLRELIQYGTSHLKVDDLESDLSTLNQEGLVRYENEQVTFRQDWLLDHFAHIKNVRMLRGQIITINEMDRAAEHFSRSGDAAPLLRVLLNIDEATPVLSWCRHIEFLLSCFDAEVRTSAQKLLKKVQKTVDLSFDWATQEEWKLGLSRVRV